MRELTECVHRNCSLLCVQCGAFLRAINQAADARQHLVNAGLHLRRRAWLAPIKVVEVFAIVVQREITRLFDDVLLPDLRPLGRAGAKDALNVSEQVALRVLDSSPIVWIELADLVVLALQDLDGAWRVRLEKRTRRRCYRRRSAARSSPIAHERNVRSRSDRGERYRTRRSAGLGAIVKNRAGLRQIFRLPISGSGDHRKRLAFATVLGA